MTNNKKSYNIKKISREEIKSRENEEVRVKETNKEPHKKAIKDILPENWDKIKIIEYLWFYSGTSWNPKKEESLAYKLEKSNRLIVNGKFVSQDILTRFKEYVDVEKELETKNRSNKIKDITIDDEVEKNWGSSVALILGNSREVLGRDGDSSSFQSKNALRFLQSIFDPSEEVDIIYLEGQIFKLKEWVNDEVKVDIEVKNIRSDNYKVIKEKLENWEKSVPNLRKKELEEYEEKLLRDVGAKDEEYLQEFAEILDGESDVMRAVIWRLDDHRIPICDSLLRVKERLNYSFGKTVSKELVPEEKEAVREIVGPLRNFYPHDLGKWEKEIAEIIKNKKEEWLKMFSQELDRNLAIIYQKDKDNYSFELRKNSYWKVKGKVKELLENNLAQVSKQIEQEESELFEMKEEYIKKILVMEMKKRRRD